GGGGAWSPPYGPQDHVRAAARQCRECRTRRLPLLAALGEGGEEIPGSVRDFSGDGSWWRRKSNAAAREGQGMPCYAPPRVDKAIRLLYRRGGVPVRPVTGVRRGMRVLVNELCTWDGAKTGVGHYRAGLVSALQSLDGLDIAPYPPAWVGLTAAGWKSCRRWLSRCGPNIAGSRTQSISGTTPRLSL